MVERNNQMEVTIMRKTGSMIAVLCLFFAMLCPVKALAADDTVVYVSTQGLKYHYSGCRTIADSITVPVTVADARMHGYEGCKVCKAYNIPATVPVSGAFVSYFGGPAPAAAPAPAPAPAAVPAGLTAEQAVQQAFALYIQNGLDQNTAMAKVQQILPQLSAQPNAYAQIVQQSLAVPATPAVAAAPVAAPAPAAAAPTGTAAEQLIQQMFAALVAQGMTPDQALEAINANLPAILAQAK